MSRVSITDRALRELRQRIARSDTDDGVLIIGPADDAAWPANTLEEAWHLEMLYGPKPRWGLWLTSVGTLRPTAKVSGVNFHVEEVGGITFEVCSTVPIPRLSIELHGNAIRVCEIAA